MREVVLSAALIVCDEEPFTSPKLSAIDRWAGRRDRRRRRTGSTDRTPEGARDHGARLDGVRVAR